MTLSSIYSPCVMVLWSSCMGSDKPSVNRIFQKKYSMLFWEYWTIWTSSLKLAVKLAGSTVAFVTGSSLLHRSLAFSAILMAYLKITIFMEWKMAATLSRPQYLKKKWQYLPALSGIVAKTNPPDSSIDKLRLPARPMGVDRVNNTAVTPTTSVIEMNNVFK